MKTKFFNAMILVSSESEIITSEMVIEDNSIIFIGNKYDGFCDKEIDCNQNLLMPGFINCHAHSPMTLFKGMIEGKNLEDWLFDINKKEEKLTKEQIYNGCAIMINECFKNGITTIQDNYFYPDILAKAFKDFGMRAVISLSQNYSKTKYLTEKQLEKLYLSIKDYSPLVSYNFYCHSTYTCDEKQFYTAIKLAKKYNTFVCTHASETLTEVGDCTQKHFGLTPIQLLSSYGFFDVKCLLSHCIFLQKEDYSLLQNKNVNIVHNPASNLFLGSGIANIVALINQNINVCLGTDGSSSNNKIDIFREMYLSSVLQKGLFNNSKLISENDALKMATENGAKAINLSKIGTLKIGNFADFIMIDLNGVNNAIKNNIKSNLVFACGAEDVLMTVINGKIVYSK